MDSIKDEEKGNKIDKVYELEKKIFEQSQESVKQGEKYFKLSQKYEKQRDLIQSLKLEIKNTRQILLKEIAGPDIDETVYQHIPLPDLIRLRLQKETHGTKNLIEDPIETSKIEESNDDAKNETISKKQVNSINDELSGMIRMEKQMRILRTKNKKMESHIEELEEEIKKNKLKIDEFQILKEKTVELVGKTKSEKDLRNRSEILIQESNDKIIALTEHIEKLMVHLKHEASSKTRAIETQKRTEKELAQLRERNIEISKNNIGKENAVNEMQEGTKILEDQLKLMDEKYIDLRSKLDWTRNSSQKEIKKLQKELSILRMKWQLAADNGLVSPLNEITSITKKKNMEKIKNDEEISLKKNIIENTVKEDESLNINKQLNDKPNIKVFPTFQFPVLPETEQNMPWSDSKLALLQKQCKSTKKQ